MGFGSNILNFGTCEFLATYSAKINCVLVHHALNQVFSSKIVLFAFIKYISHV
jgi:hypothetical protein